MIFPEAGPKAALPDRRHRAGRGSGWNCGSLPRAPCGAGRGRAGVTVTSDPLALLRSRSYLGLLLLAAVIGAPVSAAAYGFLVLVTKMQVWIFPDLPYGLGF